MEKNYILYTNSKDQREIAEIDTKLNDNKINQVIGYVRFSNIEPSHIPMIGEKTNLEFNGAYPVITDEIFNDIYGKVLTLVDAAFQEGPQKEAFKSIMKVSLSNWYQGLTNYTVRMVQQQLKGALDK